MKDKVLIQAWGVYKYDNAYYIEYSHSIYLRSIEKKYKKIYLVSPTKIINKDQVSKLSKIDTNIIKIFELPPFSSYSNAYKNFFHYIKLYKKIKDIVFDSVYTRYPSPFGWLQMLYFKDNRVVHYVGDPIDTILKNDELSLIKKSSKILFFMPEYFLFIISSLKADKVFSNGHHIANKLSKFGIDVEPLISSTLTDSDYYENKNYISRNHKIKLVYVGYLRKAKGVKVLLQALEILNTLYPDLFSLTIVGEGEERKTLSEIAKKSGLDVVFLGHVDDREHLNNILRDHHIFCFASISEGSPRVVLEAIANGLFVVTTPVGSLPYIFKDYEDILFFDFNDAKALANRVVELCEDVELQNNMKENSFKKVQGFKIDEFIRKAFNA
ncbi:glycosyltransferase family 4 protein [Psychrobacter immobilis]|uniref:glycosyltransferase family 4 protein n=1 Tax=Psychrobacter immobilis TaxID=498 RepID=UPI00191A0E99|nr:glycosyltransferase family 4 protein [Psychrobacter immobilis]